MVSLCAESRRISGLNFQNVQNPLRYVNLASIKMGKLESGMVTSFRGVIEAEGIV